jgi:hypothetical protein
MSETVEIDADEVDFVGDGGGGGRMEDDGTGRVLIGVRGVVQYRGAAARGMSGVLLVDAGESEGPTSRIVSKGHMSEKSKS